MSYFEISTAERAAIGIDDGLIRLAVGIEEPADILANLENALGLARSRSKAGRVLRGALFARLDAHREDVLGGGERARDVRGEGAGRVEGFVEIEHDLAALGQRRIEKAPRAIGFVAPGRVREQHEQARPLAVPHGSTRKVAPRRARIPQSPATGTPEVGRLHRRR